MYIMYKQWNNFRSSTCSTLFIIYHPRGKYWWEVKNQSDDILVSRIILSERDPSLSECAQGEGEDGGTEIIYEDCERFAKIQWRNIKSK